MNQNEIDRLHYRLHIMYGGKDNSNRNGIYIPKKMPAKKVKVRTTIGKALKKIFSMEQF